MVVFVEENMRIMVAIEGSLFSQLAIRAVAQRIRPEGAKVLLVHATEPAAFFEQDESVQERLRRPQELLDAAADELTENGFRDVDMRVINADPRAGLLEIAATWQPDLIVMGSHGRKGLEKLMLGSVAESVAHHASCSVLIVRIAPSPAKELQSVPTVESSTAVG